MTGMDPLTTYKRSIQERLDAADVLVSKLTLENSLLNTAVDTHKQEVQSLKKQVKTLNEQLDGSKTSNEKQKETLEVIKDLFEHLCEVRVHKSYEDDTGLWFDISQGSDIGIMDYKLGFVKGESDNSDTDVIYVPLLKQRTVEELRILQDQLPSYMFDTLSFPLKSLNQFYTKMAKCLNKKKV
ncbi:Csm1p NDAI_0I00200 [Naumovozyma dairenensis CBS 421]|uniref:Monopolin complex subunit Csm1/Pcs1 C-terminal domain-containing protein n=1 Tax=Naumovozyma dairenensis (strain ATCC 10597 / BCRC 20456 / CBS 421 / NBRC 0211 / NRRL Y-12639) TaxID=1071378 RepID=G0WFM8_NAUDC|nr:hypothetical protein NDAI_0I00200 [Naumovozyma dairenensis CBS 421]CCD26589.1 hypothetical protein NDAI_0I00200 [Naumovozyma dairenensis CBS 421]